ncbi:MAG: ribosome maturation factor RimM [Rickettsiales bacterium]|jgi:16S rRNA processing protein RimM|nr:ribosome maturation factor RimM [Rickettsiales bacterium]
MKDEKILVAEIVGAQGLRGELRAHTFTESPSDIGKYKGLGLGPGLDASDKIMFVRAAGPSVAILRAEGIDDRTAAEKLRGTQLFINRADLPALPAGEHYITDLIGMRVRLTSPSPNPSPIVAAVHNFGAGDIIELDNGEMVLFNGASVDYEKREIKL